MYKARDRNTKTRNIKRRRIQEEIILTKLYRKQEYLNRKQDNGEDTRE